MRYTATVFLFFILLTSSQIKAQCDINDVTQVNIQSLTPVTATCISNGKIVVQVDTNTGGGAYVYEIIAGPALRLPQSQATFSTLPAGDYVVRVTGCNGSVHEASTTVTSTYVDFQDFVSLSYTPLQFPTACSNDTLYSISVQLQLYSESQFNALSRPLKWQASQNANPYTGFNGIPFHDFNSIDTFYAANQNNSGIGIIADTIQVHQFGDWYIRVTDSCNNYFTYMISLSPPPVLPIYHTSFELVTLYGSRIGQNGVVWDVAVKDSMNNTYFSTWINDFPLAIGYNGCATFKNYTNSATCTGLLYNDPLYDHIDFNTINGPFTITLLNASNALDTLAKNIKIDKVRVGGKSGDNNSVSSELCHIPNHLGDTVGGTQAIPYNIPLRMLVKDKCDITKEYYYPAILPDQMQLSMTTYQGCIDTVSCDTCARYNSLVNHKNSKLDINFFGGSVLTGSPGAPYENNTSHDHFPLVIYKLDTLTNTLLDSFIIGLLIDTNGNFVDSHFNAKSDNGNYRRIISEAGKYCYHYYDSCGIYIEDYNGVFGNNIIHQPNSYGYESYFCNSSIEPDSLNFKRRNPLAYIDSLTSGSTVKLRVKTFSGHDDTLTYTIPDFGASYCTNTAVVQNPIEFEVETFVQSSCASTYRVEIKHNSENVIWLHNNYASNNPELDCLYRYDTIDNVVFRRSMMVVDGPTSTGPYPFPVTYANCGNPCDFGNPSYSIGNDYFFFVIDTVNYQYNQFGCGSDNCGNNGYVSGDENGYLNGDYRSRRLQAGNYKVKYDKKIYLNTCTYTLESDTLSFTILDNTPPPFSYDESIGIDSSCYGKKFVLSTCNQSGVLPTKWWTELTTAPDVYVQKPQQTMQYLFNLLKMNYTLAKENASDLDSIIYYYLQNQNNDNAFLISKLADVNTNFNINTTTIQILAGDTSIQLPLKSKVFGNNELCNGNDIKYNDFLISDSLLVLELSNGLLKDTFYYSNGFSSFTNIFNFAQNSTGIGEENILDTANHSLQTLRTAILAYAVYFNSNVGIDSFIYHLLPMPKNEHQSFLQFNQNPLFDNLLNNDQLATGCYQWNLYTVSPYTCTDTIVSSHSHCIQTNSKLKLGNSNAVICQNGDKKIVLSALGGTPTYYFQYKKLGGVDTFSNLMSDTLIILDPGAQAGEEFALRVVDSCGSSYTSYSSLSQFTGTFYISPDSACIGAKSGSLRTMKVPQTLYTWYKDGLPLASDSNIYLFNSPFTVADTGDYTLYINFLDSCVVDSTSIHINGSMCSYIPLPISLLSFEASTNHCVTQINWEVTNSHEGALYTIQQSLDGNTFTSIGSLEAVEQQNSYVYRVNDFHAISYYRLQITDRDNQVSYSKTIRVNTDCGVHNNDLIVFPNPTEDALQITWTSTETEDVSFILSDFTGKTLWKQTRSFTEGKQTMPLTLQGFATGSYLLQIKMADDSYFIKVIKK